MSKSAYMDKAKAKIAEWNADIEKLQAKMAGANAEAKIQDQNQIKELRKQRDLGQEKLKEAQAASDSAWDELSAGFTSAFETVQKSFQDAMNKFK